MTLSFLGYVLSTKLFFRIRFVQHDVHIRQEELWQTEGSCSDVSIINTGVANLRVTHEYANVANASQRLR